MRKQPPIIGPKPHVRDKKANPLMRFLRGRRSSLDLFFKHSYSMKMGQFSGLRRRFYLLVQADLASRMLNADPNRYPKSDLMSTFLHQILGNGIFVSNGAAWKRQRQMMDPAFDHARIGEALPQMIAAAEAMRERLDVLGDGETVSIDFEMTHVTADIIFRTIFSEPLPRKEAQAIFEAFNHYQELAYLHGVWNMAGLPQTLSMSRLRAVPHARIIRGILERMVRRRIDSLRSDPESGYRDILASLIAARDGDGVAFTETELVDQVAVMFLAGHETSASVLSWAFYLITRDKDVESRLQAEADAVFQGGAGLSIKDFRRLKFTRDVFRETLRLYPPVSFVPRDITVPETMRGKALKAGDAVFVPIWLIHRHRDYWRDPDVFDPDRFSREEEKEAVRQAFMPFSQGPRVCMGASFAMQEAVIILSYVMRHFTLSEVPGHEPKPIARLTLRSENGISLIVSKRNHATDRGADIAPD